MPVSPSTGLISSAGTGPGEQARWDGGSKAHARPWGVLPQRTGKNCCPSCQGTSCCIALPVHSLPAARSPPQRGEPSPTHQ